MRKIFCEHKGKAIVSSAVILLPIATGLLLWDKLPDTMYVHWGADGTADGMQQKSLAVFLLPLILLAAHWLCLLCTALDKKNREQTPKAMGMLFWIMPCLSLIVNGIMYAVALGREVSMTMALPLLLGVLLIVCGNYFPKVRQNSTMGIKLPWTLYNEENWNATHRFGGKVWVVGGFAVIVCAFLPLSGMTVALAVVLLAMVLVPSVYSYVYYRKQARREDFVDTVKAVPTKHKVFTAVMIAAVAIFIGAIMFTGEIDFRMEEDALVIDADYYGGLWLPYSSIDSAEYRDTFAGGVRTYGFGSARLSLGTFTNEEFGTYTRYTYTAPDACIVIHSGGRVLVLGAKNDAQTEALYEELLVCMDR